MSVEGRDGEYQLVPRRWAKIREGRSRRGTKSKFDYWHCSGNSAIKEI